MAVQAKVLLGYSRAYFSLVPMLGALVRRETGRAGTDEQRGTGDSDEQLSRRARALDWWGLVGEATPDRAARPFRCQRGDQCWVRTEEEIADCHAPTVSDPALRQMVRPILQHVAALTERAQIP